jgi:hypothetical protein
VRIGHEAYIEAASVLGIDNFDLAKAQSYNANISQDQQVVMLREMGLALPLVRAECGGEIPTKAAAKLKLQELSADRAFGARLMGDDSSRQKKDPTAFALWSALKNLAYHGND